MTKAVALLSGGLDSTLAVKMMIDQGIEVHALNFTSVFCTCNAGDKSAKAGASGCKGAAMRVAEEFGIPVKVMNKGLDYMEIVRNPRHGYGKGINPCVDCRIYMFKAAKKYMEEIGASFVITGEVLGQRPMSQRLDNFAMIEKESGLEGLILRPLCAKHLEPTICEKEGLVDRNKLMDIKGRARKEQMAKAEEFALDDYPCPSGGCLLTDKTFARKVRDLFDHKKELTVKDLQTLKVGRHFRYNGAKVVVGRDDAENMKMRNLAQPGDTLIEPVDFAGPVALIAGPSDERALSFAAALVIRYSSGKAPAGARLKIERDGKAFEIIAPAMMEESGAAEHNVC
jgi:tRNA U34 2-thiouridine synthase MnmA/TrmU